MAAYDYGFRGPRDTVPPRFPRRSRLRYDEFAQLPRNRPPSRIVARYNIDYVREQGDPRPINYNPYGAMWPGQVVGEDEYIPPYLTRGGTWTSRGAVPPIRYDYRDYGPDFGGRYPDEL